MGEYAMYGGHQIKIGTCEDMYYLRADQAQRVRPERGSVDPFRQAPEIRFRFPWPEGVDYLALRRGATGARAGELGCGSPARGRLEVRISCPTCGQAWAVLGEDRVTCLGRERPAGDGFVAARKRCNFYRAPTELEAAARMSER